ncbi:hypothetical protein LL033_04835 [Clostridium estertheticum]|uniref:hypothetical protein n=1 Tax=Clostridium estertheticum TaxID=238834 RepID=UPI001C0C3911|nr:hypothetical protein [Clostridium estertheticum]MBU3214593.1 hypothetical protein [Clostridium estertheticum]WAG56574.1 hypothetical protein LL033_04835 [Clostridium estertheticum]
MVKKYNKHKNDSENINNLINHHGIGNTKKSAIILSQEEVDSFICAKKLSGLALSIGVSLCNIAVISSILMYTLIDDYIIWEDMLGLIVPLAILLSAIPFLIYSGKKLKKYKYLRNGFDYSLDVALSIELRDSAFVLIYFWSSFIAGCLFIMSPSAIGMENKFYNDQSNYGIVAMLTIVCIAAFIFIYVGCINEGYKILLNKKDFSKIKTHHNKLTLRVVAAIWSLSGSIFFIRGCIFSQWSIIIFPITGILVYIYNKSQYST